MPSHPFIFGARGGVTPFEGISDSTQAPIYYIGWTDDSITYYITRITVSLDGTSVSVNSVDGEGNVAAFPWDDRYTVTYA